MIIYEVTGFVNLFSFDSECQIESPRNIYPNISIFYFQNALEANCIRFSRILRQIETLNSSLVILIAPDDSDVFGDYGFSEESSNIFTALTKTNGDSFLSLYDQNSLITVTNEISNYYLAYNSVAYIQGYSIVHMILFSILTVYNVVIAIYVVKKNGFQLISKLWIFVFISMSSIARVIFSIGEYTLNEMLYYPAYFISLIFLYYCLFLLFTDW